MQLPSDKVFQADERTYSSILNCELDRYLFQNKERRCVIHQPVLAGGRKNQPDGYVAQLTNSKPWLDMNVAQIESLGYCQ